MNTDRNIRWCSYPLNLLSGCLLLAATFPFLNAWSTEVVLSVQEPSGVARKAWPVTAGVPFPKGTLPKGAKVHLLNSSGRTEAFDSRVTARWRDGSAMFVLLDFQVDLEASESKRYRLLFGPGATPAPKAENTPARIHVNETPEAFVIDTGALTARIARDSFSLLEAVALPHGVNALSRPGEMFVDIDHTPPGEPQEENWLRESAAPRSPADRFDPGRSKKPFHARIEWRGSMRTVVRLDGWQANANGKEKFPYTVRLTFHAGKPWAWITHSVSFTGDVKKNFLRRLAVQQQLATIGPRAIVLGGSSPHELPVGTVRASLLEPGPSVLRHKVPYTAVKPIAYQVDVGPSAGNLKRFASGNRARGWATLRGRRFGATMAVRHFDKLFPKEMQVNAEAGTLTPFLWADRGGKVLDLRRRYDYVENKVHYDLSMYPKGGEGIGKTHELLLWFHQPGLSARDIEATVTAFERPLFAFAPPAWYGQSEFIPKFHPRDPKAFPRFEAFMDLAMEWRLRNVSQFGWYGFIDFGDTLFHGYETRCHSGDWAPKSWCSRGYVGWLNNDGAEDRNMLVHFLRSGDLRLFEHWKAMVRHVTDIDTVHCDEDPAAIGGGHRHDQQHWGNGLRGYGTATFGAMDNYLLTGDLRSLDVFKEYVNFHRHGGGAEDEYVGGYLARLAAVTGNAKLWKEAAGEVRSNHYGFHIGRRGNLDQPHFRSPTIQHPSLLAYLLLSEDNEMRDFWVTAARKRVSNLKLSDGILQFAYAYRFSRDPVFLEALKLHYSLWGPYLSPRLQAFYPATVLKKRPRDMTFEELAAAAKRSVNNLYGQYRHVGVFPYLLALAVETGMTESDLLDSAPRLRKGGSAWDWGWSGPPVKGADRQCTQTLDLRAAANTNPWTEFRAYGPPLDRQTRRAGNALRFDFQAWGEIEPGCYPVRRGSVFPETCRADFTAAEEGSYLFGMPWGARIELAGVPFDLIHPGANNGNAVILLHSGGTVSLPVNVEGKRLFLLLVADAAPFDHAAGARLTLHYRDGSARTRELRNIEQYERWSFWGIASKAHFARAFKTSRQWDGRTTLLDLLEVSLEEKPLESVELADLGRGHRLAVLAASLETNQNRSSREKTVQCNLGLFADPGDGWTGREFVAPSEASAIISGPATYHVNVPPGVYRVDLNAVGSGNGLVDVLIGGEPASLPFTLSKGCLIPKYPVNERISWWGRAGEEGLAITLGPAPGKGLWRHGVVLRQKFTLNFLAVTPEPAPAHVPPPNRIVRFGWATQQADTFQTGNSAYAWKDANQKAVSDMIVGKEPATFRADLPPGRYSILATVSALDSTNPRIGSVLPGPTRLSFLNGTTKVLPRPEPGKTSRVQMETEVTRDGLALTFERTKDVEYWGIALLEITRK